MLQAVTGEHPYGPRPRSFGTLDIIEQLHSRGMKIGATTGYLPAMMEINRKGRRAPGPPARLHRVVMCPPGGLILHMCLQKTMNLGVTTVARDHRSR